MASLLQSQIDGDDDVIAAINIVPFVDVVLVLLVIFMVTSTAIVRSSFKVDLPKAAHGGESVASTVNIVLDEEGALYLNGDAVDDGQLAQSVRQLATESKDLQAVIAADTASDYGRVIAIIDVVKANGVRTFALNIERASDSGRAL